MTRSIKNDEVARLARELAATTGEAPIDAILEALRERLAREALRRGRGIAARLDRLAEEFSRLPVLDDRTPDEIIGYDEHGLPV